VDGVSCSYLYRVADGYAVGIDVNGKSCGLFRCLYRLLPRLDSGIGHYSPKKRFAGKDCCTVVPL